MKLWFFDTDNTSVSITTETLGRERIFYARASREDLLWRVAELRSFIAFRRERIFMHAPREFIIGRERNGSFLSDTNECYDATVSYGGIAISPRQQSKELPSRIALWHCFYMNRACGRRAFTMPAWYLNNVLMGSCKKRMLPRELCVTLKSTLGGTLSEERNWQWFGARPIWLRSTQKINNSPSLHKKVLI